MDFLLEKPLARSLDKIGFLGICRNGPGGQFQSFKDSEQVSFHQYGKNSSREKRSEPIAIPPRRATRDVRLCQPCQGLM
jgi:hypothetical protein